MALDNNLNVLKQQNLVSMEPLESFSEYVNNGQRLQKQRLDDRCSLLLNTTNQTQETQHLVDSCSVSPSLSLSMRGGGFDEENSQMSQVCFGFVDRENGSSWLGSTPGGPLAEALCLGMSSSGNGGASSPYGGNSSSTSNSKSSCGDSGYGLNHHHQIK